MAARTVPDSEGGTQARDPRGRPAPDGSSRRAPLLDADQAAVQLGVHRGTLDRWARLGHVPYVRVGSRRRYDPITLRRPPPPLVPHRPDRRDEKLWTTSDVAARLGIDGATVRRLARAGTIASRSATGSRLRFSRGDIERFADQQDLDPADAVPVSQAAIALGISVRTLKRRAAVGLITLHRDLTGSAAVHRGDLQQLVRTQPPRPAELNPSQLTTHDVAVLLGRSDEWVRQQAITGTLPSRRNPGGYRRFHLDDLPLDVEPQGGLASVRRRDGVGAGDQAAQDSDGGGDR